VSIIIQATKKSFPIFAPHEKETDSYSLFTWVNRIVINTGAIFSCARTSL
jgi:hypothetical protein